ncbi:MAG: hypothetical protein V4447_02505 [Pseudomonadota bacterium]
MSPFKHRVLAAILVIVLPMANIASAGTSRSMKSGFSSQRSQQRSSANVSNKSSSTSFGSFGQQRGAPSNKSDSALNRDLEKNQAQQQAIKNMDARNQQKTASRPEQQNSVTGKPLSPAQNAAPATPQLTQAPVAPTVIVQREHSSMGAAFMGFMLGQALSRPHSVPSAPAYDTRRSDLEPIAGGTDANYQNSGVNEPVSSTVSAAKVQPVESESKAWHMLRFLLWLTFLSGLAWVSFKLYRFFVPRRPAMSNYSLGKV